MKPQNTIWSEIVFVIPPVFFTYAFAFVIGFVFSFHKETRAFSDWNRWIERLIEDKNLSSAGTLETQPKRPRFKPRDAPIFLTYSRCFDTLDKLGDRKRRSLMQQDDYETFEQYRAERDRYVFEFLSNTLPNY